MKVKVSKHTRSNGVKVKQHVRTISAPAIKVGAGKELKDKFHSATNVNFNVDDESIDET
jgi:hypothetical protein